MSQRRGPFLKEILSRPHADSPLPRFPSRFCKGSLSLARRSSHLRIGSVRRPSRRPSAAGGVMRGFFSAVNLCLKLVRPFRERPKALPACLPQCPAAKSAAKGSNPKQEFHTSFTMILKIHTTQKSGPKMDSKRPIMWLCSEHYSMLIHCSFQKVRCNPCREFFFANAH